MIYHECDFCGHYKPMDTKDKSSETWAIVDADEKVMTVNVELTGKEIRNYDPFDPPECETVNLSFDFPINYCPICGEKLGE